MDFVITEILDTGIEAAFSYKEKDYIGKNVINKNKVIKSHLKSRHIARKSTFQKVFERKYGMI